MPIQLLDSYYPWLARHSGFTQLPEALRLNGCDAKVTTPRLGLLARAIGKLYSESRGYPPRSQAEAASECEFLLKTRIRRNPGHILFLENHLQFLGPPMNKEKWIGTIHLPRKCWKRSDLDQLRRFRTVTVLCDYMADQFADIFEAGQIKVLTYGVNATFFRPLDAVDDLCPQTLMFVGAWLRNTSMLARLVPKIQRRFPHVGFDFVVPLHVREDQALKTLLDHPSVRWHHNLRDEELRSLYQKAVALILPMDDSGANNSILEALACGLPIVTTDVGGIRSYGGATVFAVVKNDDDSAFLDLVSTYLTDQAFRSSVSRASRRFAETKLDWSVAAKEYIEAYRSLGFL